VPVFEGTFRIRQDLQVATAAEFSNSLGADGKTIDIAGKLEYQACDSKICFIPSAVPVHWQLNVLPLDRQRAPTRFNTNSAMKPRRAALILICALLAGSAYLRSADTIPHEIDSRTFWRMVTGMSEETGYFRFQFMSNEVEFPSIIPDLKKNIKPGGFILASVPNRILRTSPPFSLALRSSSTFGAIT